MKSNRKNIVLTAAALIAVIAAVSAGVWMFAVNRPGIVVQVRDAQGTIYTCPMHPNYLSPEPGNCPICGMELVPAGSPETSTGQGERRILYWRDPMNPSHISDKPGKAPDGMDLVPVYADEAGGSLVKIDPSVVQNIGVQTEKAARKTLTRQIRTSAIVTPDERRIYLVTTKIMGYIEKLYVNYTGQVVKKSQPLFDLYSPDLVSAQTEYLQIYRSKTLSGSGELLESARRRLLNWDITPEQITALEQRGIPQRTLTVFSPADGLVTEKMVTEGQSIMPGMELYRIVDFARVWVEGAVYQQDVPLITVGQDAEIELDYFPGEQFSGTVTYIYPEMDMDSRTLMVRLELTNPGLRIKPGMNATIVFQTIVNKSALAVPEESVIRSGVRTLVIIARGGGFFEPREVTTGQTAEGYTEILQGVNEGEDIVVSSQFLIDSESNLNAAVRQMTAKQDSTAAMPGGAPAADSTMKGMDMSGIKIEPATDMKTAEEVPDAFKAQLDRVFTAYFTIHEALSTDSLENARKQAAVLQEEMNKVDMTLLKGDTHIAWMQQAKIVSDGVSGIIGANSLDGARTAFDRLSQTLIETAHTFGVSGNVPLYVLHCPMAFDNRGADWLQDTTVTENPYFGSAMFTCGAVTDTITGLRTE